MQNRFTSPPSGFSVRLEGASLFDLVQFECLDHEPKQLRVRAGTQSGLLYFRAGNLVHATSGDLVGEAALRAMLSWERGQISREEGGPPTVESITASWQSVLLRAAHSLDEGGRTDNVVSFPGREQTTITTTEAAMADEGPARDGGVRFVRVNPDGSVRAADADVELAETVAYAFELCDLVGEELGLETTASFELWSKKGGVAAVRDADRTLRAACDLRGADPSALKQRLERGEG